MKGDGPIEYKLLKRSKLVNSKSVLEGVHNNALALSGQRLGPLGLVGVHNSATCVGWTQ